MGVKKCPWCWSGHAPVGRLVAIVQFESPVHTTYGWETSWTGSLRGVADVLAVGKE